VQAVTDLWHRESRSNPQVELDDQETRALVVSTLRAARPGMLQRRCDHAGGRQVSLNRVFSQELDAVWRAFGGGRGSWEAVEALRQVMDGTVGEPRYYVGVDLGQSRDPTAIAVVRRFEPPGPVPEDGLCLKPKPTPQPGSVEWQEEQRRRKK
jgi:hypothetical protein